MTAPAASVGGGMRPAPDASLAGGLAEPERRHVERRRDGRVADLSVPELRRAVVTAVLGAAVAALFLWMVRTVLVAGLLGATCAACSPARSTERCSRRRSRAA